MATYETVIRLNIDNKDAVRQLGRMEEELVQVRQEINKYNRLARENVKLTDAQAQEYGELRSRAKNLSGQIRELSNETSGLTNAGLRFRDKMAQSTTAAMEAMGLRALTLAGAFEAIRRGLVNSFEKYVQQEQVVRKLQFAAGDAADALLEQAAALQKVTTVGDEAIIEQQAFLASLGFTEAQIREMIPAALNLAAATGQTLEFAVRNLSKTYGGLTGELGELIPELKNFTKEELQAGAAVDYANTQFAGQAELLATTGAGAIQQMHNSLGDLQETIGGTISPAVVALSGYFKTLFEDMNAGAQASATLAERLRGLFSAIPGLLPQVLAALSDSAEETALAEEKARLLSKEFDNVGASSEELAQKLVFLRQRQADYAALNTQPGVVAAHQKEIDAVEEILRKRGALDAVLKDQVAQYGQTTQAVEEDTAATEENTKAKDRQAAAVRILTDEMRAFLKAQQDISQGVGIGQMDIIGGLTMPELDSAATLMPGTEIADNLEENLGRVNDASAEYANLFLNLSTSIGQSLGQAFQDVEDANQKVLLSILETVRSAVRLYLSMTLGREIATKGFAGIATFAALATLVEATFAAAASSIQGFAEGGIVLGEGQRRSGAVRGTDGKPIRRSNGDNMLVTAKVGELFLNDYHREAIERMLGPNVWKALGIPGFAGGGIVSNSQYTFKKGSGGIAAPRPSTQETINAELAGVTQRLAMTPIYASWTEGTRVGRRIKMTEASSSL